MDPTGTNLYEDTGNPCLDSGGTICSGYVLDINPTTGTINWQYLVADLTGDDDIPTTATYHSGKLYLGSKNGIFYCINATTGHVVYLYDTGSRGDSGIFSSPAIYNGRVYFGGGDDKIHALHTSDFSLSWSFSSTANFISSPAEANGVIYSAGNDGYVYAFKASTGTQLWSYKIGTRTESSPTISNGVLYVSGGDGYLYAFSLGGV